MSTLLVLRHARAESYAASDHDRSLTPSGRWAAGAVGRVLAATGAPDRTLVSTARRARETLEVAGAEGGWTSEVVALDALYHAAVDDVLAALADHGARAPTVLLVGHEPWCSAVVAHLTGARARISPATLVRLEAGPGWDALDPQWCALRWLCTPDLAGALHPQDPDGVGR